MFINVEFTFHGSGIFSPLRSKSNESKINDRMTNASDESSLKHEKLIYQVNRIPITIFNLFIEDNLCNIRLETDIQTYRLSNVNYYQSLEMSLSSLI